MSHVPPFLCLCRPEEETPAGRPGDKQQTTGEAALHGCLLQSQWGALPQRPLCPWPQGAPFQKCQTTEDGPGCNEGGGSCQRCLKASVCYQFVGRNKMIFNTAPPCVIPENLGVSKEGCKKHELYVSFRDLGWQVRIPAFLWLHHFTRIITALTSVWLYRPGLDHSTRGLRSLLLRRRMCLSPQFLHERHQSRHRANTGKYL